MFPNSDANKSDGWALCAKQIIKHNSTQQVSIDPFIAVAKMQQTKVKLLVLTENIKNIFQFIITKMTR